MTRIVAPAGPADWDGYVALSAAAFATSLDQARDFFAGSRDGGRIARVATESGRVVGGAMAYPLPQRFGGREVPAGAVGDVCVAPERRGRGIARALMLDLDRAMREAGVAVSPLWPSTLRLYRDLGWEVAGPALRWSVSASRLERLRGAGEAVRDPGPEFRGVQLAAVAGHDGPLGRPEWWWRWPEPAPETESRYGWVEDGRPTGLMRVSRPPPRPAGASRLGVDDFWTATPDALRGLLGMLGSESSMAEEIVFSDVALPPTPDLLWAVPELPLRAEAHAPRMLRLVDPVAALEARGWPAAVEARVALEVHDPLVERPERLVLEVGDGRAHAAPGGDGRVRISAGGLAAWYAGGISATRAARLGLAEGSDEELLCLDALTGGRPVWLSEHF